VQSTTVILAGGQSRRMGLNKVLLPRTATDPTPVWQHVVNTAANLCDTITLLTPPDRNGDALYEDQRVLTIHDDTAYEGPLRALAGAWSDAVSPDVQHVFLLAADLPGLNEAVLEALKERLLAVPTADGAVVLREGRRQPLLGCYRPAIGSVLQAYAREGHQKLLPALADLHLVEVDGDALQWPTWWTRPVHTPADYAQWFRASRVGVTR
jgi:molybdenum cofactor guanylyltransferase